MTAGLAENALRDERALLGSLLISQAGFPAVDQDVGVRAGHFLSRHHGVIYRAMRVLHADDWQFDRDTVRSHLTQAGAMDEHLAEVLEQLERPVTAAGNVKRYALNVVAAADWRATRATLVRALEQLDAGADAKAVRVEAERELLDISHSGMRKDFRSLAELIEEENERLAKVQAGGGEIVGVRTGFTDLDQHLEGLRGGQLIIVAGRPAMGKSALVTNIADNVAAAGQAVAVFSLEMGDSELVRRLISARARMTSKSILVGDLMEHQWRKVLDASAALSPLPIHIDDSSDLSISEIRAKARRLHSKTPVGLIIVDYLQQLRPENDRDNRTVAIGEMSRGLKVLARELDIPVIALSQLSRRLEDRVDKRPMLSDLRESGAIEQDADVVAFVYREHYYDNDADDDLAEIIVAKGRDAGTATIELTFDGAYTRFSNRGQTRAFA